MISDDEHIRCFGIPLKGGRRHDDCPRNHGTAGNHETTDLLTQQSSGSFGAQPELEEWKVILGTEQFLIRSGSF